jgi:small subunit ribosomal protein S16
MLMIKLQRIGKKHQPSYRLVVAEKRSKMAAPPVEDLGTYNPFSKAASFDKERIAHWIKMGAQPTVSVHNLLAEQKLIASPKLAVKMKKKAKGTEAPATPAAAAPVAAA